MLENGLSTGGVVRKRAEMFGLLAELDAKEDFWPDIIVRITDGEFLSKIAKEFGVNEGILRNWIRGNKKKEEEFADAFRLGKQARINRVLAKTYETAIADIAEPVTRPEQLRAAEIYKTFEGAEQKAPSTLGGITINFVSAKDGQPKEVTIEHDSVS